MTQATPPTENQKPSLWGMIGENIDLSKFVGYCITIIIVAGGMAWWVISRDQVNTLTAVQVTALTARLDKVESKQDQQAIVSNTILTNQAVGQENQRTQARILDQMQQDLKEIRALSQQRQGK